MVRQSEKCGWKGLCHNNLGDIINDKLCVLFHSPIRLSEFDFKLICVCLSQIANIVTVEGKTDFHGVFIHHNAKLNEELSALALDMKCGSIVLRI